MLLLAVVLERLDFLLDAIQGSKFSNSVILARLTQRINACVGKLGVWKRVQTTEYFGDQQSVLHSGGYIKIAS